MIKRDGLALLLEPHINLATADFETLGKDMVAWWMNPHDSGGIDIILEKHNICVPSDGEDRSRLISSIIVLLQGMGFNIATAAIISDLPPTI